MMIQLVNYPFNSSVAHRPRRASEALTPPTPGVTEIGATGGVRLLNGSLDARWFVSRHRLASNRPRRRLYAGRCSRRYKTQTLLTNRCFYSRLALHDVSYIAIKRRELMELQ